MEDRKCKRQPSTPNHRRQPMVGDGAQKTTPPKPQSKPFSGSFRGLKTTQPTSKPASQWRTPWKQSSATAKKNAERRICTPEWSRPSAPARGQSETGKAWGDGFPAQPFSLERPGPSSHARGSPWSSQPGASRPRTTPTPRTPSSSPAAPVQAPSSSPAAPVQAPSTAATAALQAHNWTAQPSNVC